VRDLRAEPDANNADRGCLAFAVMPLQRSRNWIKRLQGKVAAKGKLGLLRIASSQLWEVRCAQYHSSV